MRAGCARISDIMADRTDNTGQKGPIYHFDQVRALTYLLLIQTTNTEYSDSTEQYSMAQGS